MGSFVIHVTEVKYDGWTEGCRLMGEKKRQNLVWNTETHRNNNSANRRFERTKIFPWFSSHRKPILILYEAAVILKYILHSTRT